MTLVLAFAAGLLTILSPCVLPLAPIVVTGARAGDPRGPLMLALGLALTFGLAGGVLASFGIEIGGTRAVRLAAAAILVAVGAATLLPMASRHVGALAASAARDAGFPEHRFSAVRLFGQAGLGLVLAFVWAPCVGPTLGAAFAQASRGGSLPAVVATMAMFALGAAMMLLAAGFGLGLLASRGRRGMGRAALDGRFAYGLTLAIVGAAVILRLDREAEAIVVQAMPDWLVNFATRL